MRGIIKTRMIYSFTPGKMAKIQNTDEGVKQWDFYLLVMGMQNGTATLASQVRLVVKNLPENAGGIRDSGLIPGSGRSPEEGHDNSLQYSCLENPMERRALWATVHTVQSDMTEATQQAQLLLKTVWQFLSKLTILL